jgi:hypothetical protein
MHQVYLVLPAIAELIRVQNAFIVPKMEDGEGHLARIIAETGRSRILDAIVASVREQGGAARSWG